MKLAIDTSTRKNVLVLESDGDITARRFEPKATQRVIFSELANLLVPEVFDQLDGIVVGTGPGSFTGVKIGVIAAKTLAWSRSIPLVGISSLDVVAAGTEPSPNPDAVLGVVVPSTRGEAYLRLYNYVNDTWRQHSDIYDIPLDAARLDEILPVAPFIVNGEAAVSFVDVIKNIRDVVLIEEKYRYPGAKGIFKLAGSRFDEGKFDDPLKLVPLYVRLSQPDRLAKGESA